MRYHFFTIHALDPAEGGEQLNAFLAANTVLSVERQFVADGVNSFWSVCVSVAGDKSMKTKERKKQKKQSVDYREILSSEHFAIYARLRTLRNKLAGALWAGGSINQRSVLFRGCLPTLEQSLGPWCVSKPRAESLPPGRFIFEVYS